MADHSGIGRYIRGLVSALPHACSKVDFGLIGRNTQNIYFEKRPFFATDEPIYSITEQISIPRFAQKFDCLHVPHYNAPLLWKGKLVVTIHDLIHLHFKEYLPSVAASIYAQMILPRVVKKADAIICVSEFTKQDLMRTLKINPKKITVVHHGIEKKFLKCISESTSQSGISAPYFIYVGLIKAHKNIGILLDAFFKLKKKLDLPELRLYLIGKPDAKQTIVRKWLDLIKISPSISFLQNVSDNDLISLYQHASALVFPSLYEGFGFPLLEAMACGIPIIASKIGPTLEIVGERGALYFDPHSVEELEEKMLQILNHPKEREILVNKNAKRLSEFSWEKAAQKTVQIYESALGSG